MSKKKSIQVIKTLLEKATIERLPNPIIGEGYTYWLIAVHIGKVSWFSRISLISNKELKVSVLLKFKARDGSKFSSDAYEVSKGWGRKSDTFIVQPQSDIKLAIVRRLFDNQLLYPIGGTFGDSPLGGTYDIQVIYNLEPYDLQLIPQQSQLPLYIKDGKLNEL